MPAGNLIQYVSPSLAGRMGQAHITPFSSQSLIGDLLAMTSGPSLWGSAGIVQNTAYFYPLRTSTSLVVTTLFWINGTTVNGNTDVGVYSEAGTLLGHTGSVLNSGASSWQSAVPVAAFSLPANSRLWLAIASDSATHTYFGLNNLTTGTVNLMGCKTQASAWSSGLPVSVTPVDGATGAIRFVGLTAALVV